MFGTNSAFAAFPTAAPTRPRRQASSGSFKDDKLTSPSTSTFPSTPSNGGPQPMDRPNATPSLGRWSVVGAGGTTSPELSNGFHSLSSPSPNANAEARSFSSILSPTLPTSSSTTVGNGLDPNKPFVYSRTFLLSLYDEDKARKRPIELAADEVGTRETGGKPWALSDWREGEKELFSTSIHPPTNRSNNRSLRTDPNSNSTTLDLASLGTLPRDRDRATATGGGIGSGRSSLTAGITPATLDVDGSARRARGSLGASTTLPSSLLSSSGASLIASLGGIGNGRRESTDKDVGGLGASIGASNGAKEVWQGGRWRRGGTAVEGDADRSLTSSRRFGSADASVDPNGSVVEETIPARWDDEGDNSIQYASKLSALNATADLPSPLSEPDLESHGRSILGSLSLDDPLDDPQLSSSLARSAPPPGLHALPTVDSPWQYRDPSGVIQGPFTAAMMHDWYRQSFFTGELCVRRVNEADFETLESLVRRTGDGEKPFLSASLQAVVLPAPAAVRDWTTQSQTQSNGLDHFGTPQSRPFGSFYERPNNFDAQQPLAPKQQPSSFGVDPWGAPLPASNGVPAWNDGSVFSNGDGARFNTTDQFQQSPQQPSAYQPQQHQQQPQQHQYQPQLDPFGRPLQQPYFDPNRQQQQSLPPADWKQIIQPLLQPSSLSSIPAISTGTSSWSALVNPPVAVLVEVSTLPSVANIPAPIGPPSTHPSPVVPVEQVDVAAPVSVWGSVAPVVEAEPEVVVVEKSVATAPVIASATRPAPAPAAPTTTSTTPAKATKSKAASIVIDPPTSVITPLTTPSKPPTTAAPWSKDDDSTPPAVSATTPAGPSLRQIQEVEFRQSELRKANERQAAARTQALAAVQAAQRAAAAEAESLPSSSTWAASPVTATVVDPWGKKSVGGGGKSMKEIQGEEELRRKKVAQVAVVSGGTAAGTKGYASSIGQAKANPGAPWTTVAVKPVSIPVTIVNKPLIPGGPILPSTPRSVSATSSIRTAAVPSPRVPIVSVASSSPTMTAATVKRPSVTLSRNASYTYDTESPPPPSGEFMKWCREALKGLSVPMDEFIQMLLSFPLEASSDVLEIISDSVYANSSTLDGRRFANEFSSRRKLDVSARYPGLVRKTTKVGSSMADILKAQTVVKTPEWSVKVAGGKKKKGSGL